MAFNLKQERISLNLICNLRYPEFQNNYRLERQLICLRVEFITHQQWLDNPSYIRKELERSNPG
jgi:hypothetical protein